METQFEHTSIPVAIVGMACRLPGADNLDQFWSLLDAAARPWWSCRTNG